MLAAISNSVEVSVVMPIYNAEAIVPEIVSQMRPVLEALGETFELVLVDDGSADASWSRIEDAAAEAAFVRGIKLSRNFGQQIAVSAGIGEACGKYVIVMDGDLQNPPEAIVGILERLRGGDDLVYTVSRTRNNRRDEWTSRAFWHVLTRVIGVDIVTNQLMMRGMSRRFAKLYGSYSEVTRTVAGISRDIGLRSSVLEVDNKPRTVGKSGYNFFKRFNLMINVVISLTTAPLSALIYVSLFVLMFTVVFSIYYICVLFIGNVQPGFTSLILAIFFFGSLVTLLLGIVGIYLANIYAEVRRRPLFIVEKDTKGE
jgi:glycosyltransferase involved in cell wall biosynthesis